MKRILFAVFIALFVPVTGNSYMLNGNLTLGYPRHNCSRPYKPMEPYNYAYGKEIYRAQMETYRFEMQNYKRCIQDYIDRANNDIKAISDKIEETVNQYNSGR